MIQLAGMINVGNSGGPVLQADTQQVVGVITAKNVPLLQEIDRLSAFLDAVPQVPTGNVGISGIDFGRFFNLTIQSTYQLAAVLRLVQVGTGWAIPVTHISEQKLLEG
jgi:hypothetical protein